MAVIEKNLGPVSAYAVAVANGYEGTEEQWAAEIAAASQNAQAAAGSAAEAAGSAAAAAQSVTEANNAKTAAQQAAESAAAAYGTDLLATTFSADAAYTSGQYVIYNGGLYVFTADHPAGAWIGTDARSVQVGGELTDLKSALNFNHEAITTSKNIFDVYNPGYTARTYINSRTVGNQIGFATSSTAKTYKKCVYLSANILYTLSYTGGTAINRRLVLCDDEETVLEAISYAEGNNAVTFKFSESGWLYFDISNVVPGTGIMIEQGENATEYALFNDGVYGIKLNRASVPVPTYEEFSQKTAVLTPTTNLYNAQNAEIISGYYINQNSVIGEELQTATSTSRYISVTDIAIESGKTYTLSFDKTGQSGRSCVAIVDANRILMSAVKTFNAATGAFTFTADANGYMAFDTMNDTADIMIARGDNTTYFPPDPNTYGIYTDGVLKPVVPMQTFAELQNAVTGDGPNTYIGEKLNLAKINPKINKCTRTLWKDFNSTDNPDLPQYRFNENQSIAIYNGYMFLFNNAGTGAVVDYSTKGIIASFTSGATSQNHQNSAQFTDYFYDSSDEFPLLLQSQMFENHPGGNNNDKCFIYRITRSNNDFTFTLINSIVYDHETYGVSWCYDQAMGKLYGVCFYNGSYNVPNNNPIHVIGFDMPSKADVIAGNQITLTDNDVTSHAVIDHAVIQGAYFYQGTLFLAIQYYPYVTNGSCVWAIDPLEGRVKSQITLANGWEPEGVSIYDEHIYVTQRHGSDSENTNPLRVYEITV